MATDVLSRCQSGEVLSVSPVFQEELLLQDRLARRLVHSVRGERWLLACVLIIGTQIFDGCARDASLKLNDRLLFSTFVFIFVLEV